MLKTMTVRATIAAILIGLSMSAYAIADSPKRVDIPAGELRQALLQVSEQFGTDLVYSPEQIHGIQTRGAHGELTTEQAVTKLLEGTPLELRTDASGAMLIAPPASTTSSLALEGRGTEGEGSLARAEKKSFWSRMRLAQSSPAEGESRSDVTTGEDEKRAQSPKVTELEEIVVTGTHIRGLTNDTAPVVVLDRDYIDSTGLSTTTRLMESLPQNFAQANQSRVLVDGVTSTTEQGAGINLRGLGEGTTLVLLNGRRIAPGFAGAAVDISALPLSAVERVDVLTDGASALYGSDAIGGVVNFILRHDFDGVETRLSAGAADDVEEHRVSQIMGKVWTSGNALLSLEYYDRDLLHASDRDFVPPTSSIGSLYPQDENYSAMFTGRQELTDSVSAFADLLYTHRDSYNEGGPSGFNVSYETTNPQLLATAGIKWSVGADWSIETAYTLADNEQDQKQVSDLFVPFDGATLRNSRFRTRTANAKADGPLFSWSSGTVRAAIGADWRSEDLSASLQGVNGLRVGRVDVEQIVRSAFAEVYAPLIGSSEDGTRLALSVAARYDDYSTFGSSVDPQVGLMWSPVRGLRLRGSYGSSYKAPKLLDYDTSLNSAAAFHYIDPGSPTGISHQLVLQGRNPDNYVPQKSKNFSVGFSVDAIPKVRISANYYDIRYRDQLALPPGDSAVILGNPGVFGQLIVRDPSVEQVNEAIAFASLPFLAFNPDFTFNTNFDPSTVDVIVDETLRNMSETRTSGVDASVEYQLRTGAGTFRAGLAGTHILQLEQQLTSTSNAVDLASTIYNPTDLRLRGSLAWMQEGWNLNVFVNYSNSYEDNRIQATPVKVSSYTTVDAHVGWSLANWFASGFWSGVTISLNGQNLFDEDPPENVVLTPMDMGFDPNNSNPMGRFFSLEFAKAW
jgi:outer membrane receptor protein involved in Fe transport